MTRHSRLNGLLPAPTCYGLAMGKLILWILTSSVVDCGDLLYVKVKGHV